VTQCAHTVHFTLNISHLLKFIEYVQDIECYIFKQHILSDRRRMDVMISIQCRDVQAIFLESGVG